MGRRRVRHRVAHPGRRRRAVSVATGQKPGTVPVSAALLVMVLVAGGGVLVLARRVPQLEERPRR